MRLLAILIFLFQSIVLYTQNTSLFPLKIVELAEITVTNEDLYDVYKKAAKNLKNKLIKNKEISYKIEGEENEEITDEKRFLRILFTATLEKVNLNKDKLTYKLRLSNLNRSPDALMSEIMKRNRYCVPLFFDKIESKIKQDKLNTIESNDSLIYIFDRSNQPKEVILYTICRQDTTLIGVNIEKSVNVDDDEYSSRASFKSKRLSGNISVKYMKSPNGYYLGNLKISGSRFFIFRRTKKEELVNLSYIIEALPNKQVSTTYEDFDPTTYKIYRKPNTIDCPILK